MNIVIDGKAKAGIILPEHCSKCEKFAAEELIAYIKKMTSATLEVSCEFENVIVIGSPSRNEYAKKFISIEEFEKCVPGPEGFMIADFGNCLFIAGSDDSNQRGTLYGVYEFLERYLGCSFASYVKSGICGGEFVPKKDTIEISNIRYCKKSADVAYRTAIVQYDSWAGNPNHPLNVQFISWLAKNRFNRIMTWTSVYEGFKKNGMLIEAEKRGFSFTVGHHESTNLFLPTDGNEFFTEKYYTTHPEYYKLQEDGTRLHMEANEYSGQLTLCMRNEDCIAQVAENIVCWTDANPAVDIVSLWPNDGIHEGCQCEKCKGFSKTDNYTYFISRVAEEVSKVKPDIKIDQISYLDLKYASDDITIHPSVIIDTATWFEEGLRFCGKPDGSSFEGSVYEKCMLEWKRKGANVVYYDYLMANYDAKHVWTPMADELQAVCKRFSEVGILGLGTQVECYNIWNNLFNFYTYGRTAYDSSLSMNDNLEKFILIFGAGADCLREIVCMAENVNDGQQRISAAGKYMIEHIDKERVYALFEDALEKAETPYFRNNVRMMRMVFRYSDLEISGKQDRKPGMRGDESACVDETGEMAYINKHFGSFRTGREGFGISVSLKKTETNFVPDRWYIFE